MSCGEAAWHSASFNPCRKAFEMASGEPQRAFNASRLVRELSRMVAVSPSDMKQSPAERMGAWLDVGDSISLFTLLSRQMGEGSGPAGQAGAETGSPHVREMMALREQLRDAIMAGESGRVGKAGVRSLADAGQGNSDFSPYHRQYLAHQREMSTRISALRTQVRASLARRSGAFKQLADLDALFEQAMAARERTLLASIPMILATRFQRLAGEAGDAADWFVDFRFEMQSLLLAELDVRLQPVAALLGALGHEVTTLQ